MSIAEWGASSSNEEQKEALVFKGFKVFKVFWCDQQESRRCWKRGRELSKMRERQVARTRDLGNVCKPRPIWIFYFSLVSRPKFIKSSCDMFRVRVKPTHTEKGGMNAVVMITFPFLYDLVGNYPISVADKKKKAGLNLIYSTNTKCLQLPAKKYGSYSKY